MSSVQGEPSVSGLVDNSLTSASAVPVIAEPAVQPLPHHHQQPLCLSRPRYRQGRRLTAVKAYTISDESVYLLINGVPGLKLQRELKNLCQKFGTVLSVKRLQDYPVEAFAEAHLVKYSSVREARFAKKKLDGKNFFGGVFHVCYAPELESVDETRRKLGERRRAVLLTISKQEREKRQKEIASEKGKGSVLCQYDPDDRLASAIKRVTNRLSYNNGLKYLSSQEMNSNLGNDSSERIYQIDTSMNEGLGNGDAGASLDISFDDRRLSTMSKDSMMMEGAPYSQDDVMYMATPHVICSSATTSVDSKSSQGAHAPETSALQSNYNQRRYSLTNASSSLTCDERLEYHSVGSVRQQSSGLPVGIGQQYASMSADYEPGLGRTAGEQYVASHAKNKRSGVSRKTNIKSFTIKPSKAFKRRKLEETPSQKPQSKTARSTSKVILGYHEVVCSLQQQRYRDGDAQLARLQQALHATLGTPTAPGEVRPAPDRPTAKMKLLADGVKLI